MSGKLEAKITVLTYHGVFLVVLRRKAFHQALRRATSRWVSQLLTITFCLDGGGQDRGYGG